MPLTRRAPVPVRRTLVSLVTVAACCSGLAAQDVVPLTMAESSGYQATSTSQECETFVSQVADQSPDIEKLVFGTTHEDRALVAALAARPMASISDRDERLRILVIGNIHSGECDGKEALLMLLRDLAAPAQHAWLHDAVVVLVPNYNADGNDRMSTTNRPGQIGPDRGMGIRENAQGLDLNRDFMKVESSEATALIRLMHEFDPHVFIDCHTTNGSRHRYPLTYDIPHNPGSFAPIPSYMRQQMMPRVTETLRQQNIETFYYGNFDREHTVWSTFGHEPRYSTEYAGLRGRLAILSESYSYVSYRDRIRATKAFVSTCIDDCLSHRRQITTLTSQADAELAGPPDQHRGETRLSLRAEVVAFPGTFTVLGYRDDQPHDYQCQFVGDYRSTRSVNLPSRYLIPADQRELLALLRKHGIEMTELSEAESLSVRVTRIEELTSAERPFQGHLMQLAKVTHQIEPREIPAGTWNVSTRNQLGRLAGYLLEAESDDGIVAWNLFSGIAVAGEEYRVLAVP